MPHPLGVLLCALALGCGPGASVSVKTESLPDHPLPGSLASVLKQVQRPLDACYTDALKQDPALNGTVRAQAMGSHGVIDVDVDETAPPVLAACLRDTLSGQRLARELVDGDAMVGVVFVATFSK